MTGHREWIQESVLRDMSEGVLTIGMDGVVNSVNPAAEMILEKSAEEMIGKRYAAIFFDREENDDFNQSILNAIYDPSAKHENLVPYVTDEHVKRLYVVTSFLTREGEKIGVVAVLSDITELSDLKIKYAEDIGLLLDSLVGALSTAIDERSPYNANHTRNMVRMAGAFLQWQKETGDPWGYDEDQRRALLMSVGLHDVGKLTVPLEIMDKATRLGLDMERIKDRFIRVALLDKIALLERRITPEEYERATEERREILEFIEKVNSAGFLSDPDYERVMELAEKRYIDENGERQRLFTEQEAAELSIRRGTLTATEREIMQGHAASTWNILSRVTFPKLYEQVPFWASQHHELLNGKGYPNHLHGDEIPKEVRLLTILDIFEALTAKDRPYKPPMPLEKVWFILDDMARDGSLDGEILKAFRDSGAWKLVTGQPD